MEPEPPGSPAAHPAPPTGDRRGNGHGPFSGTRRRPAVLALVARGLTRRCPACGHGRLFRRWFTMASVCPRCGRRLEGRAEDAFFLGAFVLNFAVTELALAVFVAVGFALTLPDPPVGWLVAGGVAVTVVVPLVFYPFSKTLWAAIDLFMRPDG